MLFQANVQANCPVAKLKLPWIFKLPEASMAHQLLQSGCLCPKPEGREGMIYARHALLGISEVDLSSRETRTSQHPILAIVFVIAPLTEYV